MSIRRFRLRIFGFAMLMANLCSGQQEKKIDLDLFNAGFDRFAEAIEGQTGCHFYYDPAAMDSFRISITVKQETLARIMDQVLGRLEFHYAVDADKRVFIFRKYDLQTSLLIDSAGGLAQRGDSLYAGRSPANHDVHSQQSDRLRSPVENKLFEIGQRDQSRAGRVRLAGYIRDLRTGEPVIGASLSEEGRKTGVSTDQYGYYSIDLPAGRHVLKISSIGMTDTRRQVVLYGDGKLDIDMHEYVPLLKTVIVSAEKTTNVRNPEMGAMRLNIRTIKQIPAVFGEADILRVVLTMPGVTSVGEATTGFNVRGGATDQNLVLFNDATIYNPSHFFGFFSAFNPDIVRNVELYKSSIPEKYGGRLSSVLEVTSIEGNKKKWEGTGGIGPLTARLTLQVPLDSGRTSLVIGGRRTYSDWLLKAVPNKDYSRSAASFYDLNLQLTHEINAKNSLYLTGYRSGDHFKLNSDTLYSYSNTNFNGKWKHIFDNKLNAVFTAGFDRYQYAESSGQNPDNGYRFGFNINQTSGRADFNYGLSARHTLDFGASSIFYQLNPGRLEPFDGHSLVVPNIIHAERGLETALYAGDHFVISPDLTINGGIRYSIYNCLGPREVRIYTPGQPREPINITDTLSYPGTKIIKTYHGPELRVSARYSLSATSSIKVSYNTLRQYIHSLSNTTAISPTDVWKLSDPDIRPQWGDQVSLGFYNNIKSNTIEASVEVYYKRLRNYLDYKSGAVLVLNPHIETDVLNTRGKAYGAEFLIKKTSGKLNAWISYTWSRTFLRTDDPLADPAVNRGAYYPADFDKPHNVNFIGNYRFSHRFSISLNVNYSTGRPITLPIAEFGLAGSNRVYYSDRNLYRVPDYFRADFSMNIEGNHVISQRIHNSWTIGVYNLTGRKNPYSIYFTSVNGVVNGYKLSIFGIAIPFITYNFRF